MSWSFRNKIFAVYAIAVINFTLLDLRVFAVPTVVPTTSQPTSQIVNFDTQRKARANTDTEDLPDFDFDEINKNSKDKDQFTGSDNSLDTSPPHTDDELSSSQNTLDNTNEIFGHNDVFESSTVSNNNPLHRVKQSIGRSLEPVKHLINTVRDGAFNLTHPQSPHHHVLRGHAARRREHSEHTEHVSSNDASAIETEEERESVNESNEFRFLEVLGTVGGMIWQFLMNIQRAFAASSGGASSGSSGGN
ncbi:uncharacterized protein LOC119681508 [Teleopsis dalmanni]|uniref:uncharacterized protein LOC119681508 n=1 Tax=Teleopsis dalmanni TaxID=139649 RepID=UPI0018CE11C9|nr:uncharacterized protein LOC119681508 [Teleopsis dalmanni]